MSQPQYTREEMALMGEMLGKDIDRALARNPMVRRSEPTEPGQPTTHHVVVVPAIDEAGYPGAYVSTNCVKPHELAHLLATHLPGHYFLELLEQMIGQSGLAPEDELEPSQPPLFLLSQYQRLYADCQAIDQQCIAFEKQPFWYRIRNRSVYRDLESDALRLIERKLALEYQLSQVDLTTE